MHRVLKYLPGIWLFFILISFVSAQPADLPNLFWGEVRIDGNLADNGTIVTVHNSSGDILGITTTVYGWYGMDFFCKEGENLTFKVYDVPALEGTTQCQSPGSSTNYNLSINKLPDGSPCSYSEACQSGICLHEVCRPESPYCGDGYCDEGESCASCSQDCGVCPTKKPTTAGGGGIVIIEYCGNGVCELEKENCSTCPEDCGVCKEEKSTPACTENWVCSVWSECQPNGKQTRTCIDKNNCGTEKNKPEEIRDCVYVEEEKKEVKQWEKNFLSTEEDEEKKEAPTSPGVTPSDFTGLIIGNPSFWGILVLVIIGTGILIYRKRKK